MKSEVTNEDKRKWLIGLKKRVKQLTPDSTFEEACVFYYHRPEYEDVYKASVSIALGTLGFTLIKVKTNNPDYEKNKQTATMYLAESLRTLTAQSQAEFDAWHRSVVQGLINIMGPKFTIGQGQKWLNMSLKHLSISAPEKLGDIYAFCHIPVDQYIMRGLKSDLVSPEMRQIDVTFGLDPTKYIAWSNIDNYDYYLKFQKDFRDKCHKIPLDAEFDLWRKQKAKQSS